MPFSAPTDDAEQTSGGFDPREPTNKPLLFLLKGQQPLLRIVLDGAFPDPGQPGKLDPGYEPLPLQFFRSLAAPQISGEVYEE